MSFQVLETFARSRSGDPTGGLDRIVVLDDLIAVIDGATPKASHDVRASVVADCVASAVEELPPDFDAPAAVEFISGRVAALGLSRSADACATMVVYNAIRNEVWCVGDGNAAIDREIMHWSSVPERFIAEVRVYILLAELSSGSSVDDLRDDDVGRHAIEPLLERLHHFRNISDLSVGWRHAAIDGTPVPVDLLHVIPLPADTREISLSTDGYPVIARTLAETEDRLREVLQSDPLLIHLHKATKAAMRGSEASFDDRAYVRLRRQVRSDFTTKR